jgi:hypothetical protein
MNEFGGAIAETIIISLIAISGVGVLSLGVIPSEKMTRGDRIWLIMLGSLLLVSAIRLQVIAWLYLVGAL